MSVSLEIQDDILVMRIKGELTSDDYTDEENGILAKVHKYGEGKDKLRCLAVVKDFTGWDEGGKRGDWTLLHELREKPCDFAIVGASEGIKATIKFMGTFMHKPMTKCFDTEEEALTWLKS